MIEIIIFVIAWLVLAEILYMWVMSTETDMEDWTTSKFMTSLVSAIVISSLTVVYLTFKEYPKELFCVVGGIIGLILFFCINYYLGKLMVDRNKAKIKSNRNKKRNQSKCKGVKNGK